MKSDTRTILQIPCRIQARRNVIKVLIYSPCIWCYCQLCKLRGCITPFTGASRVARCRRRLGSGSYLVLGGDRETRSETRSETRGEQIRSEQTNCCCPRPRPPPPALRSPVTGSRASGLSTQCPLSQSVGACFPTHLEMSSQGAARSFKPGVGPWAWQFEA